jgi:hypothetical protein
MNKKGNKLRVIYELESNSENNFVYDLETTNGKFNGGVGAIVLKNTDSIMNSYLDCVTEKYGYNLTDEEKIKYTLEFQTEAAQYVTSFCRSPHNLEPEKCFFPFIIFSKKRYCSNKYLYPEYKKFKQDNMGIVLKRRDNALIVKDIFGGIVNTILNERDVEKAKDFFKDEVDKLLQGNVDISRLIITKSIRGNYSNPTTIAHKVLADRMGERDPGNKPLSNDRIPYCYIDPLNLKCFKCNEGKLNVNNCKCITCMKLFCNKHLYTHKQICKKICRFCKKTTDIKQCKICKGWYCPDDMYKHTLRTDKYKVEHTDKCKKPLTAKILQGDILENPMYIKENNLIIDYKYYLDHQIEKPCMQIFSLVMKNPYSLIASSVRKFNNKKSGNQEITKWFQMVQVNNSDDQIDENKTYNDIDDIFEDITNSFDDCDDIINDIDNVKII